MFLACRYRPSDSPLHCNQAEYSVVVRVYGITPSPMSLVLGGRREVSMHWWGFKSHWSPPLSFLFRTNYTFGFRWDTALFQALESFAESQESSIALSFSLQDCSSEQSNLRHCAKESPVFFDPWQLCSPHINFSLKLALKVSLGNLMVISCWVDLCEAALLSRTAKNIHPTPFPQCLRADAQVYFDFVNLQYPSN